MFDSFETKSISDSSERVSGSFSFIGLMLLLVAQSATSGTDGPYLVFVCPILPPMDKFSDVKLGPTSAELGIAMSQLS